MTNKDMFITFVLSIVISQCQASDSSTVEGIIISGGFGAETSVEVFYPTDDKQSCVLPSLPDNRVSHTMDTQEICGGQYTSTTDPASCITFTSGQWVTSHALTEWRYHHTSWSTEAGVVIMGGSDSPLSSELLTEEYEGVTGFDMQYDTWYACAIVDSDTLLLTGGVDTERIVSRYNSDGFVEDIPPLNEGRYGHGCGVYTVDSGEQVYLVTAGYTGSARLSSTEQLTSPTSSWTMANNLPRSMAGVRGVSLGGVLYMTGGEDVDDYHDEIYQWTGEIWEEVGKMKMARSYHAVSTIRSDDDAMKFCE